MIIFNKNIRKKRGKSLEETERRIHLSFKEKKNEKTEKIDVHKFDIGTI